MTNGQEDFAARYARMGEMELMELAQSYDCLQEYAQEALRAEFARRGLEPPEVEGREVLEFRSVVTMRRFRDLAEAMVARAVLESAGIEAWIADENFVRMDWFYSNMVGGMRLQVAGEDEMAAREILEQDAPRTIAYGEDETYEQPTCPKCGAREITLGDGTERGLSFVGLWAVGIPVPPRKAVWHCEGCGAKWANTEE